MKRATAVLSRVALVLVTATLAAQTPNFTGKWVIDADKSRFELAPGFDKDRWPSAADFDLQQERLHDYWGARRYWE